MAPAAFQKGQKLSEISGNALNRMHDATRRPKIPSTFNPSAGHMTIANNIIVGINNTGWFLSPGEVVKVQSFIPDQKDVHSKTLFTFTVPDLEMDMSTYEYKPPEFPIAIVRSGGPDGSPVYAAIYGCEIAKVYIKDTEHRYATVQNDSTELTSDEVGLVQLLGEPHNTGSLYWPVLFPVGGVQQKDEEEEPEDPGGDDGDIEAGFRYSAGVVVGNGSRPGTIAYRPIAYYSSVENKIVIGTEDKDAYVWPSDFNLFGEDDSGE